MYLDLNGKGNRNEIRKQIRTGASLDPLTLRFKALLAVHDWPHEVVLQPDLRGDKYKQPREREREREREQKDNNTVMARRESYGYGATGGPEGRLAGGEARTRSRQLRLPVRTR
jgi:hypothetical protein